MLTSDPFQQLQQEYARLKASLAAGAISPAQFETENNRLVIQDAQGRWWRLGRDDGRWYAYDGQAWVASSPYAAPAVSPPPAPSPGPAGYQAPPAAYTPPAQPAQAAPQPKQGRACLKWAGCGCLVALLLLVLAGAGGYYAYSQGYLSLSSLMNLVGLGPARIEVDNFRDSGLQVNIDQVDVPQDQTLIPRSYTLNTFDVITVKLDTSGKYRVTFWDTETGTELGHCDLTPKGGDAFQFVPLPEAIIVNDTRHPASTGPELVVGTSSLCK